MTDTPAILVLAAGEGTRMRSDLPKVLHPVCGRPMLGHVLAAARALDPARIVVVTAPGDEAVRAAAAPAETCVQERPMGTGDAVRAGLAALGDFGGPVLVACGDMPLITPGILARAIVALPKAGDGLAVLGFRHAGENSYGRLVTGADGGLLRIVEARDATEEERSITLCNAGLMAATGAALLDRLLARLGTGNAKGEYYLTDAVALAREAGLACAAAEVPAGPVMGVNSRAELAAAEAAMQDRLREAAMEGGATLVDPATVYLSFDTALGRDVTVGPHVWFGPGVAVADRVEIRPYCHLEGARIAEDAVIGPFARLRPGAEIGRGAHIGNYVEVKAARVEDGAKVNHLSYIGDARVGADTNIGAGTITCNYDGFAKHRTDIGAHVFVGSNTALVAPVTVGDGAVIGAGSVITGDVAPDALAVGRGEQETRPGGGARFRARRQAGAAGEASGEDG